MGIRLYDDALVEKIKRWVRDPNMQILRPDEVTRLFQIKADMGNDKPIRLPIIALSRDRDIEILNTQKQVKTFDGFTLASNEKVTIPINVIPIQIGYQLDIYTKTMIEADEYIRNFVFNFINLPKLRVEMPYNDTHIEHLANVWVDSNITDNSDISERLFPDQFVRFTIKLVIDDAYLFSLPVKDNTILEYVDLEVQDIQTGERENEGVVYEKTKTNCTKSSAKLNDKRLQEEDNLYEEYKKENY